MKKKATYAVFALGAVGAVILIAAAWLSARRLLGEGPPLFLKLNRLGIEKVVVHWYKDEAVFSESAWISRFYKAVAFGKPVSAFPTSCLPEHPKDYSITFVRKNGTSLQVQLGLDDCGAYYCPLVDTTYENKDLMPFVKDAMKSKGFPQ